MKVKSVSGLVLKVKDPVASANFYENLGFVITAKSGQITSVRLNWFWIDFVESGDFKLTGNDNEYIYLSVSDVKNTYNELKDLNLSPTKPAQFETGRTETMISDPDDYKLVFFSKT